LIFQISKEGDYMSKDGTERGGVRPGTGRKKKPLAEKILEGERSDRPLTVLSFADAKELSDIPLSHEFLSSQQLDQMTKKLNETMAPQIYQETYKWLNDRKLAQLIKKEMVEAYALHIARWIECEKYVFEYGMFTNDKRSGELKINAFEQNASVHERRASTLWYQIYLIIQQNSSVRYNDNPHDDIMKKFFR
jgi:hypothetical protein